MSETKNLSDGTNGYVCNSTTHVFQPSSTASPQKRQEKTKGQKVAVYCCILGFVFMLASIICSFAMRQIVESQILTNLVLREGSESFTSWRDPPVHPVLLMTIFNLTNKESFLAGLEKPQLREVGPYGYRENLNKVNTRFSSDKEELSFQVRTEYFFSPEISSGSENDVVVVPNLPLFGAMKKLSAEADFAKSIFVSLLRGFSDVAVDTEPFITVTVKEFLWAYPSVLMSLDRAQGPECSDVVGDGDDWGFDDVDYDDDIQASGYCDIVEGNLAPFGLMLGRNLTDLDPRTIKTGKKDIGEKGAMVKWHGMDTVNYWKVVPQYPDCNQIDGNDPGDLPVDIKATDELSVFIGQLCRKLTFTYAKEVDVEGFQTLQFRPDPRTFDSPTDNPGNECYCTTSPCPPTGLLNHDRCVEGSPVFMSWPHFLHGDAQLLDGVEGLSPNEERHSFVFNVIAKYGFAVTALARLQMNILIEKNAGFGLFDNINQEKIFYPFGWIEEGLHGPTKVMRDNIRYLLELPDSITQLMFVGGIGLGVLCVMPLLICLIRSRCSDRRRRQNYAPSTTSMPPEVGIVTA